ncbi:hypothetical protein AWR36_015735 [Microbulbifer flavimaris]|uniref:Uncharacterized protein n=1 Tax=Microbulbifer flavimaris TaxID=1781068 RepID=A0ABX4HVK7_9GAMM|nr:hypothetical protein AVO43_15680 [Microbulbifer sp. ZGT114]PCO04130.1 hypothetical protein AWR36_015735 [Microbulbifer flavimaris]
MAQLVALLAQFSGKGVCVGGFLRYATRWPWLVFASLCLMMVGASAQVDRQTENIEGAKEVVEQRGREGTSRRLEKSPEDRAVE